MHTTQFRIHGTLHLPPNRGTAEYLNADARRHMPMTDCALYASGLDPEPTAADVRYRSAFAAVPKAQVAWIVGGGATPPDTGMPTEPRTIYLVYPQFVLTGQLRLTPKQRTSDFLSDALERRPFQTLAEARVLRPRDEAPLAELPEVERFDFVVANVRSAGGIFDGPAPE